MKHLKKQEKLSKNRQRNPIKENYVAQLSQEEKEIQAKIDEYNQRFHEINSQILELAQQGLDTKYIGGELAWPVPGYTRITSKYGMRTHPITGVYKLHTGVDVGAPMGASFIAANDGLVVKAGFNSAYGGGISTLYAHGSEIKVQEGEYVKRNQEILKVGSTGYSTGAHAHFEVRINGVVTDPMPYITNGLIPGTETTEPTEQTNEQKQKGIDYRRKLMKRQLVKIIALLVLIIVEINTIVFAATQSDLNSTQKKINEAKEEYAKKPFHFASFISTNKRNYMLYSTYDGTELVNGQPLYQYLKITNQGMDSYFDGEFVYFGFDEDFYKNIKVKLTLAQIKTYPNLETAVMDILKRHEKAQNV